MFVSILVTINFSMSRKDTFMQPQRKPPIVWPCLPKELREVRTAKEHANIKAMVRHVPRQLLELTFPCPHCKTEVSPDWTAHRLPTSTISVPIGDPRLPEGGTLTPVSVRVLCDCGKDIEIPTPAELPRGRYLMFGDEAYRNNVNAHEIIVFAAVGTNPNNLLKNEEAIRNIKRDLLPNVEPTSWRFHMKELWHADSRKSRHQFASITQTQMDETAENLFQLVKDAERTICVFCGVAVFVSVGGKKRAKTVKLIKQEFFQAFLMYMIRELCHGFVQPVLTFESDTGKETMPGFAKDAFYGLQCTAMYPFLSQGIYVPPPDFKNASGEHSFLELADFIAFVVARSSEARIRGSSSDLTDNQLGKVRYIAYDRNGNLFHTHREGVPFGVLYGI